MQHSKRSFIISSNVPEKWLAPAPIWPRDGRAQARALATDLAGTLAGRVHIVSSPSRRARQTAQAIARSTGAPRSIDRRWMEVDFGVAEGRTFAELERRAPDIAARVAAGEVVIDWPGGESAGSLHARVAAALVDARDLAATTGSTVVVVAHAGPIRVATALAEALEPAAVALVATGTWHRLGWDPASVVLPSEP